MTHQNYTFCNFYLFLIRKQETRITMIYIQKKKQPTLFEAETIAY